MHGPMGLVEEGEPLDGQRQQLPTFRLLEELFDLLLRRAVDPLVRHLRFPVQEKLVLLGQAREDTPLQGVPLHVLHAAFDLALVTRRVGLGGQKHRAVVPRERLQLGMDLGIVPVGPRHGRLEIVDHQPLGHAAEMTEGVLQTCDERFRGLPPHGLAVRLAAVAQHDAEDPGTADACPRPCEPARRCRSPPGPPRPAPVSIRRNGNGVLCLSRAMNRRTL